MGKGGLVKLGDLSCYIFEGDTGGLVKLAFLEFESTGDPIPLHGYDTNDGEGTEDDQPTYRVASH